MAPNEKKRATEEAADQLRAAILRGEFPPGTDLPGERELAVRLGVSRLTLRAALTRLESEKLVRPVQGSGTRVLDFREAGGVEMLGHLYTLAAGGYAPASLLSDLLELRRMFAVEVLGLCAERATHEEIAVLEIHVDELARSVDDIPRFMRLDLGLAMGLVKATHNLAFVFLSNTIMQVLESQPGLEAAFALNPQGTVAAYRRIASLLKARDSRRVRKITRMLIGKLDRTLVATLAQLTQTSSPANAPPLDAPAARKA
jgi:GntR family transcriptional regulator, transcriptional repressor for pyruvate dehydrogenase complex